MRNKETSGTKTSIYSEPWSLQSKQQKAAQLFKQNCGNAKTQDKNEILAIQAAQTFGISRAACGIYIVISTHSGTWNTLHHRSLSYTAFG